MSNNPKDDNLNDDLEKELGEEGIELKPEETEPEDLVVEPDEDDGSFSDDVVKKLRSKLKLAIEEKQKYLNNWQRDKADFINAKKRDEEIKSEYLKFAEANLIAELIPTLDSFELAMGNKEAWEKADKNWRVGVEYIFSQLSNTLSNHGLTKINPLGKKFDPLHHHSVAAIKTDKKEEDDVVLEVISSGYSLNGKVLRAPQVKVGNYEENKGK